MFRLSRAVEGMHSVYFYKCMVALEIEPSFGEEGMECEAFCSQGRAKAYSCPWYAVLSGMADENAFAEECHRRGQHTPALAPEPVPVPSPAPAPAPAPAPPPAPATVRPPSRARPLAPASGQTSAPSVSTHPQKPPRPAPTAKLVSKSNWEDEEQGRQRVPGHWNAPMTSAGPKEGGKRKKQKQKEDTKKKKSTKGNR